MLINSEKFIESIVAKMIMNNTIDDAINCIKDKDTEGLVYIINIANRLPGNNPASFNLILDVAEYITNARL